MTIALYNLEPQYINIALEKIRLYYKCHKVVDYMPILHHTYDKIYASSIFDFTDKTWVTPDMIKGGTGFDLKKVLPKEIDVMKPKINIGRTTEGCIHNCWFCVVPAKEPIFKIVGTIYDFWDGKSKEIELLDNNILGMPIHFKKTWNDIKNEKLKVKENGLDIRICTKEQMKILRSVRHYQYKFAWDGKDKLKNKFIDLYDNLGSCRVYVLAGGKCDWNDVMLKLLVLKDIGHDPYIMRLNNVRKEKRYIQLARWVNQPAQFKKKTFEQFCS